MDIKINKKYANLLCFTAGLLSKFCFCRGKTIPFLAVIMFYTLIQAVQSVASNKQSFIAGFCFGIGYFASSLYWVAESFKCVGLGEYGHLAVLLLVAYSSIYTGFACFLSKYFSKTRAEFMLLFPIFWTISEFLRGTIFTGFPWNLAGYIAYEIPYFRQIADIFGAYGVGFFLIASICLIVCKRTAIFGLFIITSCFFYGYCVVESGRNLAKIEAQNEFDIVVVQPSVSQEDKMNPELSIRNLERHIDLSKVGGKLIIWPEAAISLHNSRHAKAIVGHIASSIFTDEKERFVVTGSDIYDGERVTNSLIVIDNNGRIVSRYDKKHLLPFGEFIPEFMLNLGLRSLAGGIINFSRGSKNRTINIKNIGKFESVICYEIAFPGNVVDDNESKWILNITNDSWFAKTDGPVQHLRIACFRAIEEGRPIVRCANNGISAIIDCYGKIITKLETDQVGTIEHSVPMMRRNTFFSKHGNTTILCLITALLLALASRRAARRRNLSK
jgi:apolipoprotein N-acyltransferase